MALCELLGLADEQLAIRQNQWIAARLATGEAPAQAKAAGYRSFVSEGVAQGRRQELSEGTPGALAAGGLATARRLGTMA